MIISMLQMQKCTNSYAFSNWSLILKTKISIKVHIKYEKFDEPFHGVYEKSSNFSFETNNNFLLIIYD